jgi:23S rRNA pseudouridine2604 synthase
MQTPSSNDFPMRINKYLAHTGHSTRRGADELIEKRRVFINGKPARLGDRVLETDKVEVRGGKKVAYKYFAYHKPAGVITHSAGEDEEDIGMNVEDIPELEGTFPIGRLDKASSGLIILTNDGRVTDRLLNPEYEHEKEYVVKTKEKLRDSFKANMEGGLNIEGYQTKPTRVRIMGSHVFSITLVEGKKHQIRRMVVALLNEVLTLKRTRVMNIELGKLASGNFREIKGEELREFLNELGL